MGEVLSALGIVLGAIVLTRALVGAVSGRRARTDSLRVVETCPLGNRQRLHVVEVQGERLLVAAAEGRISLLRELPAATEPSAEESEAEPRPRWRRELRGWIRAAGLAGAIALLAALPGPAVAADVDTLTAVASLLDPAEAGSPDRISGTLEIVALLTVISVAPSVLLMATCFTRIIIVLSLLRQAIGVNQLPPNQVLVGLALFLTFAIMAPVGEQVHEEALAPYVERKLDTATALARAVVPVRGFLLQHTREQDLSLFLSFSKRDVAGPEEVPLSVLLPSYMISELRTAFEIGFMVFLPFLIIDLVVASVLISMGMIVLPPMVISLPFKLMLFVLLDGWHLIVGALMKGLV